jgi:hypothetical protein
MKKRILSAAAALIIALLCAFQVSANEIADVVIGEREVQSWIDGELTKTAGETAEWYVIALAQSGKYDFSSYKSALLNYLKNNKVYSASSRQKYALALIAVGSDDSYIQTVMNDSIGKQGIMSWIFGLHLLNNGYKSDSHTTESVIDKILSLQKQDGGWAVSGTASDVDTTAMAVCALAPNKENAEVKSAVDKAVDLLSERQCADGDFKSYGIENLESTAQVLTALSALSIDAETDKRFIKDGNTVFNGIRKYALKSGGYCHTVGGEFNHNATSQALYASVAYDRFKSGKSPLFILDLRNRQSSESNEPASAATTGNAANEIKTTAPKTSVKPVNQNKTEKITKAAAAKADKTAAENAKKEANNKPAAAYRTENSSVGQVSQSAAKHTSKRKDKRAEKTASKRTQQRTAKTVLSESTPTASSDSAPKKSSGGYKPYFIAAIAAAVVIGAIISRKKPKNIIFIVLLGAAAAAFIMLTNFESAKSHYSDVPKNGNSSVSIEIRCDAVAGKEDFIPEDGIILEKTEVLISDGESVYDVLKDAAAQNKIQMETSGSGGSVYVEGLANIYEFQFGSASGWVYTVNGERTAKSSSEYILSPDDAILWEYTIK